MNRIFSEVRLVVKVERTRVIGRRGQGISGLLKKAWLDVRIPGEMPSVTLPSIEAATFILA
jgi:hypothetical protein